MPYEPGKLPPTDIPKAKRAQWIEVWNSVYRAIYNDTGDDGLAFDAATNVAGPKAGVRRPRKPSREKPQTIGNEEVDG